MNWRYKVGSTEIPGRHSEESIVNAIHEGLSAEAMVRFQSSSTWQPIQSYGPFADAFAERATSQEASSYGAETDPASPSDEWFVHHDGRSLGPVSWSQVARDVGAGRFPRDVLVCRAGESEWQPAVVWMRDASTEQPIGVQSGDEADQMDDGLDAFPSRGADATVVVPSPVFAEYAASTPDPPHRTTPPRTQKSARAPDPTNSRTPNRESPKPPGADRARWVLVREGKSSAPFTREHLEGLIARGLVRADDRIRAEHGDDWIPITAFRTRPSPTHSPSIAQRVSAAPDPSRASDVTLRTEESQTSSALSRSPTNEPPRTGIAAQPVSKTMSGPPKPDIGAATRNHPAPIVAPPATFALPRPSPALSTTSTRAAAEPDPVVHAPRPSPSPEVASGLSDSRRPEPIPRFAHSPTSEARPPARFGLTSPEGSKIMFAVAGGSAIIGLGFVIALALSRSTSVDSASSSAHGLPTREGPAAVTVPPEADAPAAPGPPPAVPEATPVAMAPAVPSVPSPPPALPLGSADSAPPRYPDIRGRWNTQFSIGRRTVPILMRIQQNIPAESNEVNLFRDPSCRSAAGKCIVGHYIESARAGEGTFFGVFDSQATHRLGGTWRDPNGTSGTLRFDFTVDGESFTGIWMNMPGAGRPVRPLGTWNGQRLGDRASAGVVSPAAPIAPAPPRPVSRIERNLAICDAYVTEVRARRARMLRLQRAGSEQLYDVMERNQAWLDRQQNGAFGRAMEDLGRLMEHWQQQDDDGTSTIRSRAELVRAVQSRCQP